MAKRSDRAVKNPTYMKDIRHFFDDVDVDHMRRIGIELGTYEGLKSNALRTYFRVEEGTMPPESGRKWSKARVKTFYNWMKNGYPRGIARPASSRMKAKAELKSMSRVRKNINDLTASEIKKLKAAFQGIVGRDPDDPQSYFAMAGIHWLPLPHLYCRHHENAYNPWHRIYLIKFEDALRSVEGCEDVTIPYWDITEKKVPPVLYQAPFKAYKIPRELCTLERQCYPSGYVTQRCASRQVVENIKDRGIPENIGAALGHSHWERFNGWDADRTHDGIIRAHDNGHNACGVTMQNQDIAAFDPIFWFFHANWDRLWWKWQQDFAATTVNRFKTHIMGSPDWLDDPVLNKLPPFPETSRDAIDLSALGIGYAHPATEKVADAAELLHGSFAASQSFAVKSGRTASVRVKNIDRLKIPGSFDVSIFVGEILLGTQAFFQSTTPQHCATCRKTALASFDFVVKQSVLDDCRVRVVVELLRHDGPPIPFPLSACGNPTVNVRLMLGD